MVCLLSAACYFKMVCLPFVRASAWYHHQTLLSTVSYRSFKIFFFCCLLVVGILRWSLCLLQPQVIVKPSCLWFVVDDSSMS